jgi:hypothetical protein
LKVKHKVPEGMSDHEQQAAGKKLAELEHERASLENQARDAAASFRSKLKPLRKKISELAEEVRKGQRMVERLCEERFDPTTREVLVLDIDSGAIIERIAEKAYEGPLVIKALEQEAKAKAAKPKKPALSVVEKPRFQGKDANGAVYELTETQFHEHQKDPEADALYYVGNGKQARLVSSWQVLPDKGEGEASPPAEGDGDGAEHLRAVQATGQLDLPDNDDTTKRRSRRRRDA